MHQVFHLCGFLWLLFIRIVSVSLHICVNQRKTIRALITRPRLSCAHFARHWQSGTVATQCEFHIVRVFWSLAKLSNATIHPMGAKGALARRQSNWSAGCCIKFRSHPAPLPNIIYLWDIARVSSTHLYKSQFCLMCVFWLPTWCATFQISSSHRCQSLVARPTKHFRVHILNAAVSAIYLPPPEHRSQQPDLSSMSWNVLDILCKWVQNLNLQAWRLMLSIPTACWDWIHLQVVKRYARRTKRSLG